MSPADQVPMSRSPFLSSMMAFTNYMNILGDFITRVNDLYPADVDNDQLEGLLTTIKNQDEELEMKDKEIVRLQAKIEKIEKEAEKHHGEMPAKAAPAKKAAAKPAAKKTPAKKAPAKKTTKAEPTEEKKD